ncbi:MAG: hypothetical protein KJN71_01885 [Acidimicrobiia bacterium]|nr:hypothetical protein [Acidimicrobiia bacterium]NNC74993.1 hypothetical protein [Acidimicrobiia bacterium]
MMRRMVAALFTLALLVAAAPAAGLLPVGTSPQVADAPRAVFAAQLLPSQADYAADAVSLSTGDIWSQGEFDITVHDFLTAPSPVLNGITEVRAAVSIRNTSADALPFVEDAFFSDSPYVKMRLVDAAGAATRIDSTRPNRGSAPLARLHTIEPGMTARWVVGFRVPTGNISSLTLEAIEGRSVRAGWALSPTATEVTWMGPDLETVSLGDDIAWSDALTATPKDVGAFVCGDPTIEVVSQLVAVTFVVDNASSAYAEWPGAKLPDEPAIASWADGSSAGSALETFVGETDELWRHSGEWGFVPPLAELERAFVFAVPRDARLGDYDTLPSGVALTTATGAQLWLDLSGAEATIGLDPILCDLGAFGGAVPFAFQPNGKYEVGGEGPFPDDGAADTEAKGLVASAIAAASQFADGTIDDLEDFDFDSFSEAYPSLGLVELDALDLPDAGEGQIFWAYAQQTDAESGDVTAEALIALTESESGAWVCSSTDLTSGVTTATDVSPAAALGACAPTVFAGSGGDDGTTTTTTTTTTVP